MGMCSTTSVEGLAGQTSGTFYSTSHYPQHEPYSIQATVQKRVVCVSMLFWRAVNLWGAFLLALASTKRGSEYSDTQGRGKMRHMHEFAAE